MNEESHGNWIVLGVGVAIGAATVMLGSRLWSYLRPERRKMLALSPKLLEYSNTVSRVGEDPLLQLIEERAKSHPRKVMMGAPEGAKLLQTLLRASGAKLVVEVGVFLGYTTCALARALPEGGKVIGLDVSQEFVAVGESVWKGTPLEQRIEIRIGPALAALKQMRQQEGLDEQVDLLFIDADKGNYSSYLEEALCLVRPGGFVVIDNTLWSGKVVDTSDTTPDTEAIRCCNSAVKALDTTRFTFVNLPFADGIMLITKNRK